MAVQVASSSSGYQLTFQQSCIICQACIQDFLLYLKNDHLLFYEQLCQKLTVFNDFLYVKA